MANTEYQSGTSKFLIGLLLFIVIFIVLVTYVVSRNGDALLPL